MESWVVRCAQPHRGRCVNGKGASHESPTLVYATPVKPGPRAEGPRQPCGTGVFLVHRVN